MRGRWLLPFAFGGLTIVALTVADAFADPTFTARTEVFVPLAADPAATGQPTPADEASIFDSDQITTAIASTYRGRLDPSSDARASTKPGSNSVVVIEVEGARSGEITELADIAARVFVETRQTQRVGALQTQIDILESESAALAQQMEEMIIIDFTTRAADGIPGDTATPISEAVAELAARDAALATEITGYEQAVAALSLDGYEVGSTSGLRSSGPLVSSAARVGLTLLAMSIGVALAVGVGRRRDRDDDVSPIVPPPEFESNPMAWIDALVAEPDGVFIEFDELVPVTGSDDHDMIDLRTGSLAQEQDELRLAINPFFSMSPDDDAAVPAGRSSGVTRATIDAAANGVGRVKAALVRPRTE